MTADMNLSLPMLLSVSTETEPLGRFLDYGSVIIRTFVGRIVFHHVAHPFEVEALVKEHQIPRERRLAAHRNRCDEEGADHADEPKSGTDHALFSAVSVNIKGKKERGICAAGG